MVQFCPHVKNRIYFQVGFRVFLVEIRADPKDAEIVIFWRSSIFWFDFYRIFFHFWQAYILHILTFTNRICYELLTNLYLIVFWFTFKTLSVLRLLMSLRNNDKLLLPYHPVLEPNILPRKIWLFLLGKYVCDRFISHLHYQSLCSRDIKDKKNGISRASKGWVSKYFCSIFTFIITVTCIFNTW